MSAPSRTAQPNRTANPVRLEYAHHSQQGRRKQNEDSVIANDIDEAVLAVVADGMGGGIDGKRFSSDAVAQMQSAILSARAGVGPDQLYQALRITAAELANLRASKSSYQASGTTLVAAGITPTTTGADVALVHVGDSRAYVVRANGTLELLTRDHTYAQQLLREGQVSSANEAYAAPQAERLTHALGDALDFRRLPDFQTATRLNPGDSLVLCTDGVSKVLDEQRIASLVRNYSAEDAAAQLVEQALVAGSSDNVTALVIACLPAVAPKTHLPLSIIMLAIAGLIALGLGGLALFYSLGQSSRDSGTLDPTITALSTAAALSGSATSTPHMGATSTLAPSVEPSPTPTNTPTPPPTNTPIIRITRTPRPQGPGTPGIPATTGVIAVTEAPAASATPTSVIPGTNPISTMTATPMPTSRPGSNRPPSNPPPPANTATPSNTPRPGVTATIEPTEVPPTEVPPTEVPPPTTAPPPVDPPPADPPPADPPPADPPPADPPPADPPPADPPPADPPPADPPPADPPPADPPPADPPPAESPGTP